MASSCALDVGSPSHRPCPLSSCLPVPICVPDAGQWPSHKVPQTPHVLRHSSSPAQVPTSGVHTRHVESCSWAGLQPGGGAGSLPRPPIPPREVQGRLLPLSPLDGEERGLLPPGLPAGRQVSPQTPSPLPQSPGYICTQGLDCRREGPVQPGSGWGMGDLCSDSRAQLGGGLHPVPGRPLVLRSTQ